MSGRNGRRHLGTPVRVAALAPAEAERGTPLEHLRGRYALELVVHMAHDLRSPLSSILALAEALQQGMAGPLTDAQRRQLGVIHGAALNLCLLASDVTELARGDRMGDQRPVLFSLREMLTAVRDLVLPTVEQKQLELRIEVPTIDRRLGHPRALSRVLLNLTTNALKVTDRGSVTIGTRETKAGRMEFSVTDTGPGIDPGLLQQVGQPLHRPATDPRAHLSSSGLGLAMCRKLVAAMGSTLFVETATAQGTRFFFELALPAVDGVPERVAS